jgi:hypothetical protein
MDRGEESGNPNQVDRVRQEYDSDRRTDWVTRDSRGNRDGYSGRWADRVTQDSRCNQDYDSGHGQTGLLGSAGVTETATQSWEILAGLQKIWLTQKSRGMENLTNTESRVMENLSNMKSRVTENLVNKESRVTQHTGNMEHRVRKDSEGKNPEERKDATPSQRPAPR